MSAFAVVPAATVAAQPSVHPSTECAADEGSAARRPAGVAGHDRNEMNQRDVAAVERDMAARLKGKKAPLAQVTVPVVFHVVTATDGTGNVSDAQINEQIAEMNQDYAGQEAPGSAANTEFSFTLQAVRHWQNDSWFNDPDSAAGERALKSATHEATRRR